MTIRLIQQTVYDRDPLPSHVLTNLGIDESYATVCGKVIGTSSAHHSWPGNPDEATCEDCLRVGRERAADVGHIMPLD